MTLDVNGCRIHYDIAGSGAPVVFIQGTGVHGAGWTPQIATLQRDFTCLSFDHRGMGQSQPTGARVTVPQLAQDTLALMDVQGWTSTHLEIGRAHV